jgi:hypothetical protein
MYYIKDENDGKFRKTILTPENICSDWKKIGDHSGIITLVKESRGRIGVEFERFYLYTSEAALSALEDAMKENKRQYDELLYQHLCILGDKAIARPDSER